MKFVFAGFVIYITERLEASHLQLWKLDKYTPVMGKTFEVKMALTIQVGAHLLDLKVGHIADIGTQGAIV